MHIDELEKIVLAKHRASTLTPHELGEYLLKLHAAVERGERKLVRGEVEIPLELVNAMISALLE
jgi:hypothetical protein